MSNWYKHLTKVASNPFDYEGELKYPGPRNKKYLELIAQKLVVIDDYMREWAAKIESNPNTWTETGDLHAMNSMLNEIITSFNIAEGDKDV